MLNENEDVISFYSGSVKDGKVTLGRIVVHDRVKVEASILPRYFNHSSFASLRRQLNYFCFTRMGKGRQRGATYCNEGVVVLDDILRLKRRAGPAGVTPVSNTKRERSTSLISASSSEDDGLHTKGSHSRPLKKSRPSIVSPRSSPVHHFEETLLSEPRIALDLTVPSANQPHSIYSAPATIGGDADVLAGCRALLSFSRSAAVGEMVA